jgi:DNA-binding CsgD family transcriptional regulator/tetratricopeptide (TPR) repeat protein
VGTGTAPPFVGRDAELRALLAAWHRAAGGTPGVALVAGEAGSGKTRLVEELAAHVSAEGGVVLAGSSSRSEAADLPYLPFAQMLRTLLASGDHTELREMLGTSSDELGRLVPGLPTAELPEPTPETAGVARVRLFDLVLAMAERLGTRQPTLAIVEDVHWADASTRDMLRFLASHVRSGAILLLATWRTDEPAHGEAFGEFVAELARTASPLRLELGPLDRPAVEQLAASIAGERPSPDAVDRLIERSGGLPYFVEELAELGAHGAELKAAPGSIGDVVSVRLRRLAPDARRVARAAAVAAPHIDEAILGGLTQLGESEVDSALRELLDARVLVATEDGAGYRFRHGLLQEAAYGELLPGERRSMHERCAAALEDPAGGFLAPDAALARHWLAARRPEHALAPAIRAAEHAERAFAFAEALEGYERALAILTELDDAPDRADLPDRSHLHERASATSALLGLRKRALEHGRAAVATLPADALPEHAAGVHAALRWALWHATDIDAALADAADGLRALAPDADPKIRADLLAHTAGLLLSAGRHADAAAMAAGARALAVSIGAEPEAALAEGIAGWADLHAGRADDALSRLRAVRDTALRLGLVYGIGLAYVHLCAALLAAGRAREALWEATAGIEKCRALGLDRAYGVELRRHAVEALWRLGRWDELTSTAEAGLERADPSAAGVFALLLARVAAARGDIPAAREHLVAAPDVLGEPWTATPPGFDPAPLRTLASAEVALAAGDADAAAALVADPAHLPVGSVYAPELGALAARVAADLAIVRRARGEGDAAAADLRGFEAAAGAVHAAATAQLSGPWRDQGRAEMRRGAGEETAADWRRLVEAWSQAEAPLPAAYAAFRLAEALVFGHAARADTVAAIRDAHERASSLGAATIQADVGRLARHARVPLEGAGDASATTAAPGDDPYRLTPREREVLALLTHGRTNREIARTLFMSESTASVHVSRVLDKLGVRSRVEAATLALRLGIVATTPKPPG